MIEKSQRVSWLFHNCVAHPICGLLWFVGADRAADWLHDATAPSEPATTSEKGEL